MTYSHVNDANAYTESCWERVKNVAFSQTYVSNRQCLFSVCLPHHGVIFVIVDVFVFVFVVVFVIVVIVVFVIVVIVVLVVNFVVIVVVSVSVVVLLGEEGNEKGGGEESRARES